MSDDAIVIEQLSNSMQRFALFPEPCPDISSALERLKRGKFEAIVVDFSLGSQAGAVLEGARNLFRMSMQSYSPSAVMKMKPLKHLRAVQLSYYGDPSPLLRLTRA